MKQLLLHLPRTTEFRGPKQITVALVTRYNAWQLFLYNFIPFLCRYGATKSILSDQGREFVNSTNQTLFHLTGIKHKVTSAYHPQCNGLVERYNQTLQRSLLKLVSGKQNDWDIFFMTGCCLPIEHQYTNQLVLRRSS